MSEPNPPRRPLATFLRTAEPAVAPDAPAGRDTEASGDPVPAHDAPVAEDSAAIDTADGAPEVAPDGDDVAAAVPVMPRAPAGDTPSFLERPVARLRTPRWQWGLVTALALLLVLQIILADRARWAADAGSRPWITALCSALRCSLPPWHEPTAFTMTSREIRPVPGQPGVLQVQASIRNDARWAQRWPDLRLALSDADGRVIGAGVFMPSQYLGTADASATVDPGQSARIAFRVREPAASTDAFTFEFQ